jgi:glutamate 5-kinase
VLSFMSAEIRRAVLDSAKTVVIKIGTNALSRPDDTLDTDRIAGLAEQFVKWRQSGRRVVVVSSGAVGAGIGLLGLEERPRDLPHLQATASVGQAHLIRAYDEALQKHGLHASQILLTANDFRRRARYLNMRNTLHALFEYDVIPIINENDTVSIDEIKFGDNDRLAAMVTNIVERPLLIILSVIDGLYDGHPGDPASKVIPVVERWDDALRKLAATTKSTRGTGGMATKLESMRMATTAGENAIIANGTDARVLEKILNCEEVGTLFLASRTAIPAWKRWIGYTVNPSGQLHLDAGATKAVLQDGRSLLAIGVKQVSGNFSKGDRVSLLSAEGAEVARGLVNFDSPTLGRIAGKKAADIRTLLGEETEEEVVHRDNLVVM